MNIFTYKKYISVLKDPFKKTLSTPAPIGTPAPTTMSTPAPTTMSTPAPTTIPKEYIQENIDSNTKGDLCLDLEIFLKSIEETITVYFDWKGDKNKLRRLKV